VLGTLDHSQNHRFVTFAEGCCFFVYPQLELAIRNFFSCYNRGERERPFLFFFFSSRLAALVSSRSRPAAFVSFFFWLVPRPLLLFGPSSVFFFSFRDFAVSRWLFVSLTTACMLFSSNTDPSPNNGCSCVPSTSLQLAHIYLCVVPNSRMGGGHDQE
jgi:hypothetical protein